MADGFGKLEAGDICRRELHMLSSRTLRELLPDEAKHQSMKRLPPSSSSLPKEEIAADPPQIEKNAELPQELQRYAAVEKPQTQVVHGYQRLTGQRQPESKPELEPGQTFIPHAEWDANRSHGWGECPKCKKTGHERREDSDKQGTYEVYWMHPDLKNYAWKICKIGEEVKKIDEETQEIYEIDPKDYDLKDLELYDRKMLIRIVRYLHDKLSKRQQRRQRGRNRAE